MGNVDNSSSSLKVEEVKCPFLFLQAITLEKGVLKTHPALMLDQINVPIKYKLIRTKV